MKLLKKLYLMFKSKIYGFPIFVLQLTYPHLKCAFIHQVKSINFLKIYFSRKKDVCCCQDIQIDMRIPILFYRKCLALCTCINDLCLLSSTYVWSTWWTSSFRWDFRIECMTKTIRQIFNFLQMGAIWTIFLVRFQSNPKNKSIDSIDSSFMNTDSWTVF